MMVAPVENCYGDGRAGETHDDLKAAESGSNDNDMMIAGYSVRPTVTQLPLRHGQRTRWRGRGRRRRKRCRRAAVGIDHYILNGKRGVSREPEKPRALFRRQRAVLAQFADCLRDDGRRADLASGSLRATASAA